MEYLPDELLIHIFQFTIENVHHLLRLQIVCRRFYRIANHASLWYRLYKRAYPLWTTHIPYMTQNQPLIEWKSYVIGLSKKQAHASQLQLLPLRPCTTNTKEPFVYDIDPVTQTGLVAMVSQKENEHKIVFLKYPSYELFREIELKFIPTDWSCQILGLQTVWMNSHTPVQLFSVVISVPEMRAQAEQVQDGANEWKTVLIYHLNEEGSIRCLAHVSIPNAFLGRGVYFFSSFNNGQSEVKQWLSIVSPDSLEDYDPENTLFMLAFGLTLPAYSGCGHIIQFDMRGDHVVVDPAVAPMNWDERTNAFHYAHHSEILSNHSSPTAKLLSSIRLGPRVSCMIHFRYPPQLNHLICVGSLRSSELTLYDWRFGIKVGSIWNNFPSNNTQPWGFEYSWSVPIEDKRIEDMSAKEMEMHGLRLVAVGDKEDKFEIKIWDISDLFRKTWNPFENSIDITYSQTEDDDADMRMCYPWWDHGTRRLQQIALDIFNNTHIDRLPYHISQQSVLIIHTLDTQVKYTAYNISETSLYLLTQDGHLAVMDVESGQIIGKLNIGIGIDINVISSNEIVITHSKGLFRCKLQ